MRLYAVQLDYKFFNPGFRCFAVFLSLLLLAVFSSDLGVLSRLPSVFRGLVCSFPRLVTFLMLARSQGDFFLRGFCCCSSSGFEVFWSLAKNEMG